MNHTTLLHHLIAASARRVPDAPALSFAGATQSYAELDDAIVRFAGGLIGLGLERSERVAIYLDKRPETVTAFFGASAAGGVFVPVTRSSRPSRSATSCKTATCACW